MDPFLLSISPYNLFRPDLNGGCVQGLRGCVGVWFVQRCRVVEHVVGILEGVVGGGWKTW